ncbi:DoxX family protein [Lutimonas zeaxanthinifaciens]|uniref:DoxX family protein n=1 Tax=Lutimonas zeaxanthinifaciens TaxID=3060215 RepID=UPI00265CBBFF|nr:DoxX family protein [Lutimonas sp. YSD2104]WKK64857.1 DoxX family protein [Lutimonas sp. YSD2104]
MKFYIERISSIMAAILFLQTLYFKFSAAPESVFIFSELGMEPYGRIGTGIIELIVGVLLLRRSTAFIGAILGLGVISGAILSHLLILGIEVENDGGFLFGIAILVFILLMISLILQKDKLLELLSSIRR